MKHFDINLGNYHSNGFDLLILLVFVVLIIYVVKTAITKKNNSKSFPNNSRAANVQNPQRNPQTKKCPDCTTDMAIDNTFCIKCGFNFGKYEQAKKERLKENEKECPECKLILNKDIAQCTNCGFPFQLEKTSTHNTQHTPPQPKVESNEEQSKPIVKEQKQKIEEENSDKTLYFVLGSLLLLIVIGIVWYSVANSGPSAIERAAIEKAKQDSIATVEANAAQEAKKAQAIVDSTDSYIEAQKVGMIQADTNKEVNSTSKGISQNPNLTYGTVNDIDGNSYKTVNIGTQIWMAENLKVTRYRNGDLIPNEISNNQGAWCYYDNDKSNNAVYGKLYNWYAVNDIRGISPIGWHVPTESEWTVLENYLGGNDVAGGKMKESGTIHWGGKNTGGTNESGFKALPGGRFNVANGGSFIYVGYYGFWWSATESGGTAWSRLLDYTNARLHPNTGSKEGYGLSVRCVKD